MKACFQVRIFVVLALALIAVVVAEESQAPRYVGSGWRPVRARGVSEKFFLPPHDLVVPLTVFLRQSNLDLLKQTVLDVSLPRSPKYGQHLSQDEITEMVAPSLETLDAVRGYFERLGALQMDLVANKDVMRVSLPLRMVERAFGVKYEAFESQKGNRVVFRSEAHYTLPQELVAHVDLVLGISDFAPSRDARAHLRNSNGERVPMVANAANEKEASTLESLTLSPSDRALTIHLSNLQPGTTYDVSVYSILNGELPGESMNWSVSCSAKASSPCKMSNTTSAVNYTPYKAKITARGSSITVATAYPVIPAPAITVNTLKDLYHIPRGARVTNPRTTQAVVEFEQQYYSPRSLSIFLEAMGLDSDVNVTVVGPNDVNNEGGEAALDIQWIMGMAPGAPTTFWSIEANSPIEIDHILTWCYQMLNTTDPPLINSVSYGMTEIHVDVYLGKGYLQRTENELAKMAARGLTVIIADGDVGSVDVGPPPMSQRSCGPPLHADWPSNSQYVTAIGSTYLTPNSLPLCYSAGRSACDGNPIGEVAVGVNYGQRWTTGGGFSDIIPRASWQNDVIEQYLREKADTLPPSNFFNASGKAYPVAVVCGHNLDVYLEGAGWQLIDGTSASAPIFAGIITLLADASMNHGGSAPGLVTPLLYELATSNPEVFNDVTVGENNCGSLGFSPVCCDHGYKATSFWDAVTGFGSPNYSVLHELVMTQAKRH